MKIQMENKSMECTLKTVVTPINGCILLLLRMQLLICCTGCTAEHMPSDCHGASSNSLSNGVPGPEITPRARDMCPIQYHSQKV